MAEVGLLPFARIALQASEGNEAHAASNSTLGIQIRGDEPAEQIAAQAATDVQAVRMSLRTP